MNELSLFSGVGGTLGGKLLGWTTVGYVENNDYCQKVLAQRIEDGILDRAPIFGDINGFIESGAAKKYKGFVDVVTGGFPCQPFSVAGRQEAQNDPRNLWPQTLAVLCDVRPRYALLENVTGLLVVNDGGYFAQILSDLAESGFDAKWCVLGADDVGAAHRRKRLWILAYPNTGHDSRAQEEVRAGRYTANDSSEDVADSTRTRREARLPEEKPKPGEKQVTWNPAVPDNKGNRRTRWSRASHWPTEPDMGRIVPNGMANRVDRLKAIGNGQVPRVFATAWELLNG